MVVVKNLKNVVLINTFNLIGDEMNYKTKIKWFKFLLLLFKKHFRDHLKYTIFYGFTNHHEKAGEYACDVQFFQSYYYDKIIKE